MVDKVKDTLVPSPIYADTEHGRGAFTGGKSKSWLVLSNIFAGTNPRMQVIRAHPF
jgi:hypothetical protein